MEEFVRYSDDVDTLQDAFAFVMTYMDLIPRPSIKIRPMYDYETGEPAGVNVCVSGIKS